MQARRKPVVFCVLDGWGHREETQDNAIALAATPVFDRLLRECPHGFLRTSGPDVGLPPGQMGNSEVGHLNLGAGRIVNQEIQRIGGAIADGSLAHNKALTDFVAKLKASGGACHVMGLMSPGGVHSHQDHIIALARIIADAGVKVWIHAFLDGRDMPPASALDCLGDFAPELGKAPGAAIATISGRYYAMDRDKRWDRVAKAYAAIVDANGEASAPDAGTAIRQSYDASTMDEFVLPTVVGAYRGMQDGDGVVMANFRADRAREILTALLDPAFDGFERARRVSFAAALGMVSYSTALDRFLPAIFTPVELKNLLGELVAAAGMKQLRIAETEKYAHVTFFFNGGREEPFAGEDRVLVPSPKVATYDLQPEMSADEVTDKLVEAINAGKYDFIFVNYANPDMVGHSGILKAAIAAVETIDRCLGRLADAVAKAGGVLLITADHGNVEMMRDPETGEPHTAHTLNVVPLLLVNGPDDVRALAEGRLCDIAPTVLRLLGLSQPAEMTGKSLLMTADAAAAADFARASV